MSNQQDFLSLFKTLLSTIGGRRRLQFLMILLLTLIGAFAEVLGIGAVIPFLSLLVGSSSYEIIFQNSPLLKSFLGDLSRNEILFLATIIFILATIFAGVTRVLLLWVMTKFSYVLGSDIGLKIYKEALYKPYSYHLNVNSSEIISGITTKAGVLANAVVMSLMLISALLMLTAILCTLIYIDYVVALSVLAVFGFLYFVIIKITGKQLEINSNEISRQSSQVIKALQEGLGGIRDIIIDSNQDRYSEIYEKSNRSLLEAQGRNTFIAYCPRYVMEAVGVVVIAVLAYALTIKTSGVASSIPVLGALAISAQRLLPLLQQSYGAWSSISGNRASIHDAILLLPSNIDSRQADFNPKKIFFNSVISLKNIKFKYNVNHRAIIDGISFDVPKGARVGIIGVTGSGKSTLLDLLMGLLSPTEGVILVDGTLMDKDTVPAWQKIIAHVPQSIYLADSSISENIAFGVPSKEINQYLVEKSAKDAQLHDFISQLPNGYKTNVGERGVRLSGGQRQRIGIARALYKKAEIIILDEATSALDVATEAAIMENVKGFDGELTIFVVAHRLTTLKDCDFIIELNGGRVIRTGSYAEIISK